MPTKVHIVKAMVSPVDIYRCESWTIKKHECQRIDAFKDSLRVWWTARRSNQSTLKEINLGKTDAEAEAPILWPPDVKSRPLEKTVMLGKEKGAAEDEMVRWHHRLNGNEFE